MALYDRKTNDELDDFIDTNFAFDPHKAAQIFHHAVADKAKQLLLEGSQRRRQLMRWRAARMMVAR